jgi:fructose-1,6-bisphosphatase/inositol monophosphatase family enzyme
VDLYSARGGAARLGALSERAWLKDFGSSAFHGALLASARAEAYVNLAHKTHELGAIMLLAKESGAAIGLLDGSPLEDQPVSLDGTHPIVAARSPEMLEKIRELMV